MALNYFSCTIRRREENSKQFLQLPVPVGQIFNKVALIRHEALFITSSTEAHAWVCLRADSSALENLLAARAERMVWAEFKIRGLFYSCNKRKRKLRASNVKRERFFYKGSRPLIRIIL